MQTNGNGEKRCLTEFDFVTHMARFWARCCGVTDEAIAHERIMMAMVPVITKDGLALVSKNQDGSWRLNEKKHVQEKPTVKQEDRLLVEELVEVPILDETHHEQIDLPELSKKRDDLVSPEAAEAAEVGEEVQ